VEFRKDENSWELIGVQAMEKLRAKIGRCSYFSHRKLALKAYRP
jgi:hypothetical protein